MLCGDVEQVVMRACDHAQATRCALDAVRARDWGLSRAAERRTLAEFSRLDTSLETICERGDQREAEGAAEG